MDPSRILLLKVLGQGAMGTVYLAETDGPGGVRRKVAVKVLSAAGPGAKDLAARLRDEARMLALLRHRAIVSVEGLVELSEGQALVMELVEGQDLETLVKARGPLPAPAALELVAEVAGALHAAYAQPSANGEALRLLHRDVKPANVRVTPRGEVKILDFGVARADFENREAVSVGLAFGSLAYMAPERLDFKDGHAGDVYALGCTLFEALTGRRFGPTRPDPARHAALLRQQLESIGAQPPAILALLQDLLDYDPARRPDAQQVERRARALMRSTSGPGLAEWLDPRPLPHEREPTVAAPAPFVRASQTEWVALPLPERPPPPPPEATGPDGSERSTLKLVLMVIGAHLALALIGGVVAAILLW